MLPSADLHRRLEQLTPDDPRQWGSMSVNQMLAHCADQLRICLGELPSRPRGNKLTQGILRWISLNLVKNMPKNMRTISELDPNKNYMTRPTAFAQDQQVLIGLYQKMLGLAESHRCAHPVFGTLTKKEVIKLTDMHLDHHLRQFGR
jgi:Protein of unknown function (DUF1569)